jgi:exonuclease SbcC
MRIERIISTNLTEWEDLDLTFPEGPVLLFSEGRSRQRTLGELFLELFYNQKNPRTSKTKSCKGRVEVWLSKEDTARLHISRQFIQQDDGRERASTLEIEDETGQTLTLPETMTLGEYLFRVKPQAFRHSGIIEWLEDKGPDDFSRRVRNLRHGGEEGLSLAKVRASIVGAQKRVIEQTESMALVKANYDALRHEWEEAHRQQEQDRLRQIELKNLQEKEKILVERIACETKMQERLAVLRQNQDYRELRYLQGELTNLEELRKESEANLTALTLESQVDWAMIEDLREECLEWAGFQEQVDRLAAKVRLRVQEIRETEDFLQTSGYLGVSENEVQRLSRVEEERNAAQEELDLELDNLIRVKWELENTQTIYTAELAKLQNFANMAEVTDVAEIKIAQREKYLALWQRSQIGSFLDRVLRERFGVKSIAERLSLRLAKYYQTYHTSNYQEFTSQLKEFRERRQLVERLQTDLERLQEKVRWEEKLRRIVNSRNAILKRACSTAKVADFPAWLNGWENYQQKKQQLTLWNEELQRELKEQQSGRNKVAAAAERLREKLGNWGTPATDREEILAVVMKVAKQLRVKDEAEKEVALYTKKYYDMLGERNLEQLAEILEPLADLEREIRLSNEDRVEELAAWRKEQAEITQQLVTTEQSLQHSRKFPSLAILEKKIERAKRQWLAYEGLHGALDDARDLLETSWQEWQIKYGKDLQVEKQWILRQVSSSLTMGTIAKDGAEGKKEYFAYRMATAQLALRDNIEVPLFFSVKKMTEGENFWEEILRYFQKLSLSRQVIFTTSDAKLWKKLAADGWQRLNQLGEQC